MLNMEDAWKMRSNRVNDVINSNQAHLLGSAVVKHGRQSGEKRKSSGSDDGKEDGAEAVADRRLTIHCIVEEIASLDVNKWKECPYNCGTGDRAARAQNSKWWLCDCRKIEMNSCVVIKASTSMSELVKTVLAKLGYPSNAASSAMGSILIRNWKALSLSAICPSPRMTVGDILGDLSSLATLQIQILRPKHAFVQEMKDRLLSFLVAKNHALLSSSGCPLDLLTLSKPCDESLYAKRYLKDDSSDELQQRFEAWLTHVQKNEFFGREASPPEPVASQLPSNNNNNNVNMTNNNGVSNGKASKGGEGAGGAAAAAAVVVGDSATANGELKDNAKDLVRRGSEGDPAAAKGSSPIFEVLDRSGIHCTQTKTRMRTSFDPDLELPKLLKWYLENPHPTRQQINEYVQELNSLESRRGRKKLDMNNVVYWFKNARAAQKRSEYRKFCNIPVAGAKKNCNVLKIPLGKTSSGPAAEEQHVPLSDDEPSVIAESENTFRNGNGKCMQVLGNWNSNGAGEAVLEMKITPPKACVKLRAASPIKIEEDDNASENGESSREGVLSIAEESEDVAEVNSADENRGRRSDEGRRRSAEEREKRKFDNRKSDDDVKPDLADVRSSEKSEEKRLCGRKVQQRSNGSVARKANGFTNSEFLSRYKAASQNSILRHPFMYMSQCMNAKVNNLPLSSEERRKRNRTFIDPLTEVPRLEQWFQLSTHPSHSLIVRYTEELNGMPYRRKFPKLETKNVQFWFKNRRAKNKRLNYLDTNNFLR